MRRVTNLFLRGLRIMPPRKPLAQRGGARAKRGCREYRPQLPGSTPRAIREVRDQESRRRRYGLRGRRLRERAWPLRASEPCRQRRRGIARGARFLRKLRRKELFRRRARRGPRADKFTGW